MIHRIRSRGEDGHDIIRDIDAGPGPVGHVARKAVTGGVLVTDGTPPNAAVLMHFSKGLGGTRFNGRRVS